MHLSQRVITAKQCSTTSSAKSPLERAYCARLRAHPGPVPSPVLSQAGPLGSSRFRLGFSRSGLRPPLHPEVSRCPTRAARPALPQNPALTEDLARVAFGEHTAAQLSRAHTDLELQRGSVCERAAPLGHGNGYQTDYSCALRAQHTSQRAHTAEEGGTDEGAAPDRPGKG